MTKTTDLVNSVNDWFNSQMAHRDWPLEMGASDGITEGTAEEEKKRLVGRYEALIEEEYEEDHEVCLSKKQWAELFAHKDMDWIRWQCGDHVNEWFTDMEERKDFNDARI